MTKRFMTTIALVALAIATSWPLSAAAKVEDLPGMDSAANLKEWLKLTDDQVAKLEPVIDTRIEKVDAALRQGRSRRGARRARIHRGVRRDQEGVQHGRDEHPHPGAVDAMGDVQGANSRRTSSRPAPASKRSRCSPR